MIRKEPLIKLGVMNENRRIYTDEAFKDLPKKVPVKLGMLDNAEIIGEALISQDGELIIGDISLDPEVLDDFLENRAAFVSCGISEIDSDGKTVRSFTIDTVLAIPKEDSAWKGLL